MAEQPTAQYGPLVDEMTAAAAVDYLCARLDHGDIGALDPEMHAHGVALAAYMIEHDEPGVRAVALVIANELDVEPGHLRRFLRPWYEGARDLLEDHGRMPAGVDGPDAVRAELRALIDAPTSPPSEAPDTWEAALTRAEHVAARPVPTPSAQPQAYVPPAAALSAETAAASSSMGTSRRRRKRTRYRFSDLFWGAFFVPGVLIGLVVFLYFLALPPMSWLTGIATWDVREEASFALLGVLVWLTPLTLMFPPIWYAWRRGYRSWVWPMLVTPPVTAILVFMSTLIVLRSPMHPDFLAGAVEWAWMWGPVTVSAAISIAFGPRLRGLSRRMFRHVGGWWDSFSGGGARR